MTISPRRPPARGVTLIELVVALTVLTILAAMALPSFLEFRHRQIVQGAADQVAAFWTQARFEALKRDRLVKFGFRTSGANFCLGAAVTNDPADNTTCDCFSATGCDVAAYPASQADWKGTVVAAATTIGSSDSGVAVIDPKRGGLTDRTDGGRIFLQSPTSGTNYLLNVVIDGNGRAILCEPSSATHKLPGYTNRRC